MPNPLDLVLDELRQLDARGLHRTMRHVEGPQGAEIRVDGRTVINFSSNGYLGLADHPGLRAASMASGEGFGAGASRLISGNLRAHRELETRLAAWKGCEAALLFGSGYQANLGVVSALAGPEDTVYSDAWNHASLIDGARLSRARIRVYPHADLGALEGWLRQDAASRRRIVLSDSVFSMDGDCAPLEALRDLARRYQALLVADDAHAVGVLGTRGQGLGAAFADLTVGTLGKALGGYGAYAVGSAPLIDLLVQRARSFVFTTALPVPVVAWAAAAIDLVAGEDGAARRARLGAVCERFHAGLRGLGVAGARRSHIVPLIVGDARAAMALCDDLLAQGVFAQGIRPPTVPEGSSRLRFSLMATHRDDHVDAALAALARHRGSLAP